MWNMLTAQAWLTSRNICLHFCSDTIQLVNHSNLQIIDSHWKTKKVPCLSITRQIIFQVIDVFSWRTRPVHAYSQVQWEQIVTLNCHSPCNPIVWLGLVWTECVWLTGISPASANRKWNKANGRKLLPIMWVVANISVNSDTVNSDLTSWILAYVIPYNCCIEV